MNFNNAQFEKAFAKLSQLDISDLPEICFSGRSNAEEIIALAEIIKQLKYKNKQ